MQEPGEFRVRLDDFSLQIASDNSKQFWIRVGRPSGEADGLVFTDFSLDDGDADRALAALDIIRRNFRGPRPGMRLTFLDIYPDYVASSRGDKLELARRHDQIVNVIRQDAIKKGYTVENAVLDTRLGIRAVKRLESLNRSLEGLLDTPR